ncbi:MAG: murein biosynthesis integral membrane protein MurJ [Phycisphaerae bacterium]|nr:murein biosynthesis integral membrane protein MurJ [Phycisphaerae bacterium]
MTEKVQFVGSARIISALTLASRILGLARDMLCGHIFGASGVMSAFTIGFQVPNLFRRLFGEGALSASSIPILSEHLHHGGTEAVDRLAGRLMGALAAVLVGVVLLGEIVVLVLRGVVADTERNALTFGLTALLLLYTLPICLSAILGGIQNIFGRFAVPAANAVVLNCFMIAALTTGTWWFADQPNAQVYWLAASVVAAGVFQLVWQWISARGCGLRLRPMWDVRDEAIRSIGRTMIPMTLGLGVVQLNTLLDGVIAYGLVRSHEGGPAVLFYAQRLYQFPLGVFAIALATAIFPALSRHAAAGEMAELARTVTRGVRVVLFEGFPCMVGLILVRMPLIETILEHGAFGPDDTARVAATLVAYALGIWAFGLNQIIVRAFYAMKDATAPLRIAAWMVGLNLALNLILVFPLEEVGLALSTTFCAALQTLWLLVMLARRLGELDRRAIWTSTLRTMFATGLMAAAVLIVDVALADSAAFRSSLIRLACLVGVGAVTYVLAAWLVRCRELAEVVRRG